jgi:hypothetical protein
LRSSVKLHARRAESERVSQILVAESSSRFKTLGAFKAFLEPEKMASHAMARITQIPQPLSELHKFNGEAGAFVTAVVSWVQDS